jgi:uncharacterized metal-binding protein
MRYGIALVGDRVAPRCVFAEAVLVVVLRRNAARTEATVRLADQGLLDLAKVLSESRIDVLVCGGISNEEREFLAGRRVKIIDNVAGPVPELLEALESGMLCSGFGLAAPGSGVAVERPVPPADAAVPPVDCLACHDQRCMRGESCEASEGRYFDVDQETGRMLEASLDISSEKERTLCRLSELIYFCLEMRYRRIGLAYCIDLVEPAETLTRVLRRFFDVYPVCCKAGGVVVTDPINGMQPGIGRRPSRHIACNPRGQAEALNRFGTDVNVLIGLCIGTDCIFSRYSDAPVTTLFVKDKSLANNPIGAVYSDYYLKEAAQAAWRAVGQAPGGELKQPAIRDS